jgi:acyl carrier protein
LQWTGAGWQWGPGDDGSDYIVAFVSGPDPPTGWQACDGSTAIGRLNSDGTVTGSDSSKHSGELVQAMTTFDKVRLIVAEELGIAESEITAESNLRADLDADSLDIASLVIALEAEFGRDIADDDLPKLLTIADIVQYAEAA